MTDLLTGLITRHQLHLQMPGFAVRANPEAPLSLLLLKIKDFPLWQSRLTPLAADHLLTISAKLISEYCPAAALAARWGGSTFALLLPSKPLWQAENIALEINQAAKALALPGIFRFEGLSLEFYVGGASMPPDDLWQLIFQAETELKRSENGFWHNLLHLNSPDNSESTTATASAKQGQPPAEPEVLMQLGCSLLSLSAPYLPRHSSLTASLAVATGRHFKLSDTQLTDLKLAAIYADSALPQSAGALLHKPGPLTMGEYRKIQRHPALAADLCQSLNLPETVCQAVLYHHERPDGKGYPQGLKGEKIPPLAAILAGAAIYAALVLPRPYRPAYRPFAARQELTKMAGKAIMPEIVQQLLLLDSASLAK